MFRFDCDADRATHEALIVELGPRIRELGDSPTVEMLIHSVANETPADRKRLYSAIDVLRSEGEYRILGPNGEKRQRGPQTLEDRLIRTTERSQFLSGWN